MNTAFPTLWHLVESSLTGATVAGTVLLGVCTVYWLMLIAGAVDLHLFDFDLHADAGHLDVATLDAAHLDAGQLEAGQADINHSHGAGASWGMAALKFMNVNDVPLMIWLSIFAFSYWLASVVLDGNTIVAGDWNALAVAVARSGAIALVATKLLTEPLRGKFDSVEPNAAATLIGRNCIITSSTVTTTFGQALIQAEGAPLILHVRGPDGLLHKNDTATIVGYQAAHGVFQVQPLPLTSSDHTALETT